MVTKLPLHKISTTGTRRSFQTVITNTHLRKSTDSQRPRYAQKECGNEARKIGTDPLCRTENTRISFILVQMIMSRRLLTPRN